MRCRQKNRPGLRKKKICKKRILTMKKSRFTLKISEPDAHYKGDWSMAPEYRICLAMWQQNGLFFSNCQGHPFILV
jgi:uncharacterized protein YlxP (DUF503 family)